MLNFNGLISKKMLRTLIIDDEQPVRESLLELLHANCPNVKIVGQAGSVKSGVDAILKHHPDLILLDIKMADGTGFDLLEQIEPAECKVIFITAYNEYAIKAIKFSALDYLLKPVDSAELIEAINRTDSLVSKELNTQIDTLVHNLNTTDRAKKKIILRTYDNIYLIRVPDIICCESDGRCVTFYLQSSEKVLISNTLKYYEALLGEFGFYRIHKSYLINMEHIQRFEKSEGGYIILTGNLKIPVASRKREELMELFDKIVKSE